MPGRIVSSPVHSLPPQHSELFIFLESKLLLLVFLQKVPGHRALPMHKPPFIVSVNPSLGVKNFGDQLS